MNTLAIPTAEEIQSKTKQDLKDSEEASAFVKSFEVSSNDDLRSAVAILKEIKLKYAEIELKRKNLTGPLNSVIKELNANFKPALQALQDAEAQIKKKVSNCVDMRLEARESVLDKLAEAPEERREAMLVAADELVPPDINGLTIYRRWSGIIEDEPALFEWIIQNKRFNLLDIDTRGLEELTRDSEGKIDIPGWKAIEKPVVRIDTK